MKMIKMIESLLNKISYSTRHEKALMIFDKEISKHLKMSDNEFIMKYVDVSSRYEHKKTIFSTVSVVIITSIFMNVWNYLFDTICNLLKIDSSLLLNGYSSSIVFYIVIVVGIVIFMIILLVFIDSLKCLNRLSKEKLFLEEIKSMRMGNTLS